MQDFVM